MNSFKNKNISSKKWSLILSNYNDNIISSKNELGKQAMLYYIRISASSCVLKNIRRLLGVDTLKKI